MVCSPGPKARVSAHRRSRHKMAATTEATPLDAEERAQAIKDEGNVFFKAGSYQNAISRYSKAISVAPAVASLYGCAFSLFQRSCVAHVDGCAYRRLWYDMYSIEMGYYIITMTLTSSHTSQRQGPRKLCQESLGKTCRVGTCTYRSVHIPYFCKNPSV